MVTPTVDPSKQPNDNDDAYQKDHNNNITDGDDQKTLHEQVADYYGKQLQTTSDLQTNACACDPNAMPKHVRKLVANIHDNVLAKYYGCGLCLPTYDLTGAKILDLGCGAGRDVYIGSQLVGPTGKVVGVDMTKEQLDVATSTRDYHATKFGYDNVEFYQGTLEQLNEIEELELGSFDVIISNCVLNLCADKKTVLQHCWNLLKPGGEMHFSDVYANRRVPTKLQQDPMLWGECLSGALYWNDFETMARKIGFMDPRIVESGPITINNPDVIQIMKQAELKFYSATYRLWKLPDGLLEPYHENYRQVVRYKGTIPMFPLGWRLDRHYYFETDQSVPVCGNTWNMLSQSPLLQPHFDFIGSFDDHYGIMDGFDRTMPFVTNIVGGAPGSSGDNKAGSSSSSCCGGGGGGDGTTTITTGADACGGSDNADTSSGSNCCGGGGDNTNGSKGGTNAGSNCCGGGKDAGAATSNTAGSGNNKASSKSGGGCCGGGGGSSGCC